MGCSSFGQRLKKNPLSNRLKGHTIGLILQKPSTRTSVSFASGIVQLGGHPLILNADVLQIKRGESPRDTGRVLSRYLSAIVIRANRHEDVVEMANYATIPLINGLTDLEHPCQILADLLTLIEKKKIRHPREFKSIQVTYLGDCNNVAYSWIFAAALLGFKLNLACPKGYGPRTSHLLRARRLSKGKADVNVIHNPSKAIQGAHVLYTDVWTSMGQESETKKRKRAFHPYQLNKSVLRQARPGALVMHCLPAHRGEEITEGVLEGRNSVIFDQAENRLHAQKAVLVKLLK